MKTICNNVIRLPPSKSSFEDFLCAANINELQKNRDIIEICVPESYAIEDGDFQNINHDRCFGCLLCVDIGEIKYLTQQGSPTSIKPGNICLDTLCKCCFQGNYFTFRPAQHKLANHTKTNETNITNPLAALYLWSLSSNPSTTFFCSSPSWELSLPTSNHLDEREGHLDVTVLSNDRRIVIVLEGKSSMDSLLRDINRDQWNRYNSQLYKIAGANKYDILFSFVIGGDELGLYPDGSGIPHHPRRNEFYEYISENNKKFISIESLRALRACQISFMPDWNWEDWVANTFSKQNFVGLLSGGLVLKEENDFYLEKAPWV